MKNLLEYSKNRKFGQQLENCSVDRIEPRPLALKPVFAHSLNFLLLSFTSIFKTSQYLFSLPKCQILAVEL